jgi:hypothetical protein
MFSGVSAEITVPPVGDGVADGGALVPVGVAEAVGAGADAVGVGAATLAVGAGVAVGDTVASGPPLGGVDTGSQAAARKTTPLAQAAAIRWLARIIMF